MSYSPNTDFLALLRKTPGGVRTLDMPGLDVVVAALARAGLINLAVGPTAPLANRATTAWFQPASPSWASEGQLFLWNGTSYQPAMPALWTALLGSGTSIFNVKQYGAAGDGVTDDTAAINAAIAAALAAFSWSGNQNTNINDTLGARGTVYFPAGTYAVSSPLTRFDVPIALKGDGSSASILLVANSFSGEVISYSECWGAFNAPLANGTLFGSRNGPHIEGLSIAGQSSSNVQHGVVFHDRNDMIYMRDVTMTNLNGWGLSLGVSQTVTQAYVRESHFHDLRFFNCGNPTYPSIEIGTVGNGDRSNTCYWSGIDIFASGGDGLVMRSNAACGNAADTQFFDYLRIESPVGSGLKLGDVGYAGRVSNNFFDKFLVFGIPAGKFGVELHNGGNFNSNYQNRIAKANIGISAGGGIKVAGGRDFYYQGDIGTTQTCITVGPTTGGSDFTAGNLIFDLFKNDGLMTTSIDASATGNVWHPSLASGV